MKKIINILILLILLPLIFSACKDDPVTPAAVVLSGILWDKYSSFLGKAKEKCVTHEIGHHIGMFEHETDTGCYASSCVMKQHHYEEGDPVLEKCHFCDYHTCWLHHRFINGLRYRNIPTFNSYSGVSSNSSNIKISISSSKNEYLELEPVWLIIKIKNEGGDLDSIQLYEKYDLLEKLEIITSDQLKLPYHSLFVEHELKYIKMQPDEELSYDIEISEGFGNVMLSDRVNHSPRSYFSEGQYNIQSHYKTSKGISHSNTLKINIKKPEEPELKAFNDIIDIYQNHGIKIRDYLKASQELETFIKENSTSVYCEQAFYYYMYTIILHKELLNKNFIDNCLWFFGNFQNSFYSYDILKRSLRPFVKINGKSQDKLMEYLRNLVEKYPRTKIGYAAESFLTNVEYIQNILK